MLLAHAGCAGAVPEPGQAAAGHSICHLHVQHHQAHAEALQEPAAVHLRAGLPREGHPLHWREGGHLPLKQCFEILQSVSGKLRSMDAMLCRASTLKY